MAEWEIWNGQAQEPEKVVGLEYTGAVKLLIGINPHVYENLTDYPLSGIIWFNGQPFDLYHILENHFKDMEDKS